MDRLWPRRAPGSGRLMSRWLGVLCRPLSSGMRDVACGRAGRFQYRRVRGLDGDVRPFSLRCPCSKQRVHSGLYDGLTWPDTGCASLD